MRCDLQVWKDALTRKQQSPYMRHTLAGGTLKDLHFCPYEVQLCSPSCLQQGQKFLPWGFLPTEPSTQEAPCNVIG